MGWNNLKQLSKLMFDQLEYQITNLELEGNPWECDCELWNILNRWAKNKLDVAKLSSVEQIYDRWNWQVAREQRGAVPTDGLGRVPQPRRLSGQISVYVLGRERRFLQAAVKSIITQHFEQVSHLVENETNRNKTRSTKHDSERVFLSSKSLIKPYKTK